MCARLGFFTFLFAIVIAFLPVIGHPVLESDTLFDSDSGPSGPLLDDNSGAADALYTDPDLPTDVLASAPLSTENVDVSIQAPTDMMDTGALNPDLLGSPDPPLLLAAEDDWDWDCPTGKKPFCCVQGETNPFNRAERGGCRNLRNPEVADKNCHPELRACCVSVDYKGRGFGCEDVALASTAIQWPDLDLLRGLIDNSNAVGGVLWDLITEKV